MQILQPSRRNKLYQFMGKTVVGLVTACIGLGVAAFGFGRFLSSADDFYINAYPSPSGIMKAALISRTGGSAISPYCTESIAVAPITLNDEELTTRKFEIYSSSDCDTFADHSPSPLIEWVSDTKLRVSISINRTAAFMKDVQLKKQDASGQINIEFLIHP